MTDVETAGEETTVSGTAQSLQAARDATLLALALVALVSFRVAPVERGPGPDGPAAVEPSGDARAARPAPAVAPPRPEDPARPGGLPCPGVQTTRSVHGLVVATCVRAGESG